jgi:two-component sensor histidine kinase
MKATSYDDEITNKWGAFVEAIRKQPNIDNINLQDWNKCKISFAIFKNIASNNNGFEDRIIENKNLINAAVPFMDSLNISFFNKPHLIILSYMDGFILSERGMFDEFVGNNLDIKNEVDIKVENKINTDGPLFIYNIENHGAKYGLCGCMTVPLIVSGVKLGQLCIIVPMKEAKPERFFIAIASAHSIENVLQSDVYDEDEQINESSYTSELTTTLIHDLKNPLAIIRGLGQLGKFSSDLKCNHDYFKRIIKQTDILDDMVVDFLNVMRPKNYQTAVLRDIVFDVVSDMQPVCDINSIKIKFISSCNEKASVVVELIKRAVQNLIKNAIQAMQGGGEIEVEVKSEGKDIIISVKDNGPGIPDEIINNLYSPFVHKNKNGTGLGLYMVKYVVCTVHKGKIQVDTNKDKGTIFNISIPSL